MTEADEGTKQLRERVESEAQLKAHSLSIIRQMSSSHEKCHEAMDFTRVTIGRPSAFDPDQETACTLLDKAMAMRKAWQDKLVVVDPDEQRGPTPQDSPKRSSEHGHHQRNRRSPHFDPFAVSCPPEIDGITVEVVNGVFQVNFTTADSCRLASVLGER